MPGTDCPLSPGSDCTQDQLAHELRRVLSLSSLPHSRINVVSAFIANDEPYLDLSQLPTPEPGNTSDFAMVTRLVQGGSISGAPHEMADHYPLRQWLIKSLGARLSELVDRDSKRLMARPDACLPGLLSDFNARSVPTHLRDLARWSKRDGVIAISFRNIAEYTNRLRYFDMEVSLSIIQLMGLIAEVEKRLEGLPLANADQWSNPPAVASVEKSHDAPPKMSLKPQKEEQERRPLRQLAGPQPPASQEWAMTVSRCTPEPGALEQRSRPRKMPIYRDSSTPQ